MAASRSGPSTTPAATSASISRPSLTRRTPGTGERPELLAREKKALQAGLATGLAAAASCGRLDSDRWDPGHADVDRAPRARERCVPVERQPLVTCGESYQPGLSDHDYEVLIPSSFFGASGANSQATCVTDALSNAFTNADGTPKEIDVGGIKMSFDDITFFPVNREAFDGAKLDVLPPNPSGGDATGDLGLGRQQLLLKWLLEGEYVSVPGLRSHRESLDAVLSTLRTTTKIPALEGYEWGTLQKFNLVKSRAFIRIAGSSAPGTSLHDIYISQVHDTGKAGIRAALARMIADPADQHPGAQHHAGGIRQQRLPEHQAVIGIERVEPEAVLVVRGVRGVGSGQEPVPPGAGVRRQHRRQHHSLVLPRQGERQTDAQGRARGRPVHHHRVAVHRQGHRRQQADLRLDGRQRSRPGAAPDQHPDRADQDRRRSQRQPACTSSRASSITDSSAPRASWRRCTEERRASGPPPPRAASALGGGEQKFFETDADVLSSPTDDISPADRNLNDLERLDVSLHKPTFVLGTGEARQPEDQSGRRSRSCRATSPSRSTCPRNGSKKRIA